MRKKKLFLLLGMVVLILASCRNEKKLQIAFLTDLHVVPGNLNDSVFKLVVQEINSAEFDFVVITGDLTNMGSDNELMVVKQTVDSIKVPVYILPGNHETNWSETGGATYKRLFGDDRFFVEHGRNLFVGFNTGPYMKMGDGHVKKEDLGWLKQRLKGLEDADKRIISLAHYPLADGLDNWPEVTGILKEAGVSMALCGHGHRLQLLNFNGIPGVMGRSLVARQKNDIGYNIVELQGDSVWVSEKPLGGSKKIVLAWDFNDRDLLSELKVSEMPDYSINKKYSDVRLDTVWTNDASILGGFNYSDNGMLVWLSSNGELNVVDDQSRLIKWTKDLGKPQYSTPVISNDLVITGTFQGVICAYDINSGNVKWQLDVGSPVFSEGVIEGRYLYVGCGKKGFYKIDTNDGKIKWHFDALGGFVQTKPTITEKDILFGAWDRHLYCLAKETGQLRWKWNNGHKAMLYSPGNVVPAVANNKVFIVAPDRFFTVLDLVSGQELYRTNEHMVRESAGLSEDGSLFFAKLMNDSIVAYSTENPGKGEEWVLNVGFGYEHNPCPLLVNDNVLFGGTKNGEVFAIDVEMKKLMWRHKLSNSAVNKLIFVDNKGLMVNTMDGIIVVLN